MTVLVSVHVIEVERAFVDQRQGTLVLVDGRRLRQRKVPVEVVCQVGADVTQRQVDSVVVLPTRVNDAVLTALPRQRALASEAHAPGFEMLGDRTAITN